MAENIDSSGKLVPLCKTETVSSEEDVRADNKSAGQTVKLERRATEDKECMTDSIVYVMVIENNSNNRNIGTQAVASIVQGVESPAPLANNLKSAAQVKPESRGTQNAAEHVQRSKPVAVKDPKSKRKDTMWLMHNSSKQLASQPSKTPIIPNQLSSIFHRDKRSSPTSPTQSEVIQFDHLRGDRHIATSETSTIATPVSGDSVVTNRFNNNQLVEVKQNNLKPTSALVKPPNAGSDEPSAPVREQWDRKLEFLLAIIGFSVDLGNIWRFPKIVFENGGGKFLIPYFVQLLLCGLPLFYMELALGQFHQTGVFTLWEKLCPILKGIAFTAMSINIFLAMFYNTVIAWAVYYLFLSFNTDVPWKGCDNEWNTQCCLPINSHNDFLTTGNFTTYQKITQDGAIYRLYKNDSSSRLTIFNTNLKKNGTGTVAKATFYEWVYAYYNTTNISVPLVNTTITENDIFTREYKVQKWLDSYFILTGNKTNLTLAGLFENATDYLNYAFDPGRLVVEIEKNIKEHYGRLKMDYELIVNCFDHMNNPTQEFYTRHLTQMHKSQGIEDLGSPNWPMIVCLFLVFVTVYFALWKGIKSAGKAVWITAVAPYIVLFILLVRGFTLPGYEIGMKFYLTIGNWEELRDINIWIQAATQIFFSLGPGFGTIIALSSYNKKKNNIYKDALLTSFINCFTSILSGCVVFSTLGHMAHIQNKTIQDVTEPGPGLIFVAYPQAISTMPYSPFWAVIFFFMLFTLGIDSTFGGLESVITGICDAMPSFGKKRSRFVFILISICFVASMPTVTYGGPYIVNLFDEFAVAPAILFVVVLEVIGIMYIYGCDRFSNDIFEMLGFRPGLFWIVCWMFVSPGIVISIIGMFCSGLFQTPAVMGTDYRYDGAGQIMSFIVVCAPISLIIIYMIFRFAIEKGNFKERFYKVTKLRDNYWAAFDALREYMPVRFRRRPVEQPSTPDTIAERKQAVQLVISDFSYSPRDPVNL